MKKTLTLQIPEPCHENWNQMTSVDKGHFCSSCNKTVLDFTQKSDEQIIEAFESHEKVCGRFKTSQLNRQLVLERKEKNSFRTLIASGFFSFLTFGYYQEVKAQGEPKTIQTDSAATNMIKGKPAVSILKKNVIRGTILDDNNLPLPGVNVIVKGTTTGTYTDFDGNFEIKAEKEQTLELSFLGYLTKEVVVDNTINLIIKMKGNEEPLEEIVVGGITSYSYCEPKYVPTAEELEQKRLRTFRRQNHLNFYKRKRQEEKEARKQRRDSIKKSKQQKKY